LELAIILAALTDIIPYHKDTTILSDSLCSLLQIHKTLRSPMSMSRHLHKQLIWDIVEAIQHRAALGSHTHLGKVQAHIGIIGNEKADQLANQAAALTEEHDITISSSAATYPGLYWPGQGNTENSGTTYIANMHKHLMQILPKNNPAAPQGIYCTLWNDLQKHVDPKYAAYIHNPKIPASHRRTTMLYRFGSLWNAKLAARYNMAYTAHRHAPPKPQTDARSACPLCGQPDSGGHMLSSHCEHPHIKGLAIKRHNEATIQIAQAIRQSPLPRLYSYLWMDAGCDVPSHLLTEGQLLPTWLLPNLDDQERRQLRPDILYIPNFKPDGWETEDIPQTMKTQLTIYIAEIGYGPDTRYTDKLAEKQAQHTHLIQLLQAQGWTVADPCIFVFGVGGTIYKSFHETLHKVFQLPPTLIDKLAHQLQRHAITSASLMVSTRRHLERTDPHSRSTQQQRRVGPGSVNRTVHGPFTKTRLSEPYGSQNSAHQQPRPAGGHATTAGCTTPTQPHAPAPNHPRRKTVLPLGGERGPGTRKQTYRHTLGSIPYPGDGAPRATKRRRDAGGGG
jgi:hypothetical protein